ncbi:unnamed protein product [Musa acuminata subsp. burmannicoides]
MIPSSPSFGIALEVETLENSHDLTENSEMLNKMLERDDVKDVSLGSLRVIWCIQTIHSASFTQIAWMMRQSTVEGNEFHIHSVKPKLTAVQMEEGEEKNEAYGDGGGRKSGRSHGHGRRCIREKLTQVALALVPRGRHRHHAQEHRSGHHSSREPRHQLSRRSGEGGHKESTPTTKPIYKTPSSILSPSLVSPAKGETTTQWRWGRSPAPSSSLPFRPPLHWQLRHPPLALQVLPSRSPLPSGPSSGPPSSPSLPSACSSLAKRNKGEEEAFVLFL